MDTSFAQSIITSGMPDIRDASFDSDVQIDVDLYSRIMRQIGRTGDESVTPVYAFNSSI